MIKAFLEWQCDENDGGNGNTNTLMLLAREDPNQTEVQKIRENTILSERLKPKALLI